MKKIALYIPSMSGGGAERMMLTLANALAEKNLVIDLVLNKAEGPYLKKVSNKVNIVDLDTSRVLTGILPLARYMKTEKPEVVLSAMNYVNVATIFAKLLSGTDTRIILSERSNLSAALENSQWISKVLLKNLMTWTYKRADKVVAISNGVANDLANQIKLDRNHIVTIYNPVVSSEVLQKSSVSLPSKHPWFEKDSPPVIIAVGRLSEEKDFETLIKSFAKTYDQKECRLLILGEGGLRPKLETLIEELKLQDIIQLPGFSDNPYAWMSKAKLFILSSKYEGFGNVLVEAMACGTAVVSTDCPSGPSEILEEGKWGELVPVGNVELMSRAMLKAISTSNHINVQSRASFFSVETSVNQYINVLL
ncbi:glycosyltransferase [Psychrobacter sp. T6-6]|uniref:glycosyltransferase n=1 Tax=Psychrobacter sp. T6-6 TaxID=3457452 RepID=UPI003FD1FCBA